MIEISKQFRNDLAKLINIHSLENGSDTPDYIIAEYLCGCLENYNKTVSKREKWYGREKEEVKTLDI